MHGRSLSCLCVLAGRVRVLVLMSASSLLLRLENLTLRDCFLPSFKGDMPMVKVKEVAE